MKSSLKSFLVASILVTALVVQLAQVPIVYSEEGTAQDKTLRFMRDVIKLDMTKYDTKLSSYLLDYPSHLGGLSWESVEYTLDSADASKLLLTCIFRDKMLSCCILEVLEGSPIYADSPPANLLDATKVFLKRYQTYSGASYIKEVSNMLDTVNTAENTTRSSNNIKLTISSQEVKNDPTTEAINRTTFEWIRTVNGVDAPQNVMTITFDNGVFKFFKDDWNLYKTGSSTVNVSRDKAVEIARNAAKNYTLKIWLNEWVEVPFNITEEPVSAELFMRPRETLTIYPFWRIQLYFDKLYYSAYGIEVGIWADTGETAYCESLSYTGGTPNGETPSTSTAELPPLNTYLITATAAIIIVTTVVILALKKRRK